MLKTYIVARLWRKNGPGRIVCVLERYVDALPTDLQAGSITTVRATSGKEAVKQYRGSVYDPFAGYIKSRQKKGSETA